MAVFTNQATLSYNGQTVNSNIVSGEVTEVLTINKRASVDTYNGNDVVTYVLNIQNLSANAISGITITDDLGAYTLGTGTYTPLTYTGEPVLYYQNGLVQASPAVTAGPPMVISNITVPGNGNTTLVYRALVNEFAPLGAGQTITNTANITGGGLTNAVEAVNTITTSDQPALTILKAVNPTVVAENGVVTYTFTIQNTGAGEADAASLVSIVDTFDPILENISVTLNNAVWAETGNYTYDQTSGLFTTTPGQITVPAATFTQVPGTGQWTMTPGVTVLTVTGTI